jgi:hypothetical protein
MVGTIVIGIREMSEIETSLQSLLTEAMRANVENLLRVEDVKECLSELLEDIAEQIT